MQPHVPFLVDDSTSISRENFEPGTDSAIDDWDRVTRGELDRETAIRWYRQTLTKVLDDVTLLLSNIDADSVVVSADHGEAFGESGIYGHPDGIDLPGLTDVPWVETRATDEKTHEPERRSIENQDISKEERLKSLGYKE